MKLQKPISLILVLVLLFSMVPLQAAARTVERIEVQTLLPDELTVDDPQDEAAETPRLTRTKSILLTGKGATAKPATTGHYDIIVGQVVITDSNRNDVLSDGGSVKYNPDTKVLTLNNPTINSVYNNNSEHGAINIQTDGVTVKGTYHMTRALSMYGLGVSVGCSVALDGSFTFFGTNCGIISNGDITVKSGSLRAVCTGNSENNYAVYCASPYGPDETGYVPVNFTVNSSVTNVTMESNTEAFCGDNLVLNSQRITSPVDASFADTANGIVLADLTGYAKNVTIEPFTGTYYNLWVGARHVDSQNYTDIFGDGKASYSPSSKTLTLNYPNGTNSIGLHSHAGKGFKIYSNDSLNLAGTFKMADSELTIIPDPEPNNPDTSASQIYCGVLADGDLTLNGDFNLIARQFAVYSTNDLTVSSGTLTANAADYVAVVSANGKITVSNDITMLDAQAGTYPLYAKTGMTFKSNLQFTLPAFPAVAYEPNLDSYYIVDRNNNAVVRHVTVVPKTPQPTVPKDTSNTRFGTAGIGAPRSDTVWVLYNQEFGGQWSYVYYGKYNGKPVRYRVLDRASNDFGVPGGSLLLDCDNVLKKMKFFDDELIEINSAYLPYINKWQYSTLKSWLNSFLSSDACFTSAEREAIAASVKSASAAEDGNGWAGNFQPLTGEKIFVLDNREVSRATYGYITDTGTDNTYHGKSRQKKDLNGETIGWWLRTYYCHSYANGNSANVTMIIGGDNKTENSYWNGAIVGCYPYFNEGFGAPIGVSPAMNISLSSILFNTMTSETNKEYKLTLKDSAISASVTEGQSLTRANREITVPYTVSSGVNRLSLLITDRDYNADGASIRHYQAIKTDDIGTSGTVTFTLPADCRTSDKFYLLAEKVGGSHETDYAGEPCLLAIPTFTVTFNANGGTCEIPSAQTDLNGLLWPLPKPSNGTQAFAGWFTEADGGEKITKNTVFTSDTTVYAQWAEVYGVGRDGEIVTTNSCIVLNDVIDSYEVKILDSEWYAVTADIIVPKKTFRVKGTVNLIICDGAKLQASRIDLLENSTLNIYGQSEGTGELEIESNMFPAIGSAFRNTSISIFSGTITARGFSKGSGIGSCGSVSIYGGTITARGGIHAGGISCSKGSLSIYGGDITATGGSEAAGISCSKGSLSIYGGNVTATGGYFGAGIGGNMLSHSGDIFIYGGTVTATGGEFGAGIGGGSGDYKVKSGDCDNIWIYGGKITASSGRGRSIGPGTYLNETRDGSKGSFHLESLGEGDYLHINNVKSNVYINNSFHYVSGDTDAGAVTADNILENGEKFIVAGKSSLKVSIEGGDRSVSCIEDSLTLSGTVGIPGKNGSWNWTSSNPYVADVSGYGKDCVVRIYSIGTTTITAAYESDRVENADSITLEVVKAEDKALTDAVRCVDKNDTGFTVDLKELIPKDAGQISSYAIDGEVTSTGTVTVSNVAVSDLTSMGINVDSDPNSGGISAVEEGLVTATISGGSEGDTITVPVRITAANYDCTVNAVVTLISNDPVSHSIGITDCVGGIVTADRRSAIEGESVLLTVMPDYGSTLDSITVTDSGNNEIPVTDGQFIMPDDDVTVTVSFNVRLTYDWAQRKLTLVSGDYDNTADWGGLICSYDPLSITAEDGVRFTGNCSNMFLNFSNCESIDFSKVDTSQVTDMSCMFYNCGSLRTLDITGWDTSNVSSMMEMFMFCSSLTELDLSGLVTATTTNLSYMFDGCTALETVNTSGWNTSGVVYMNNMFSYCESLEELDLSAFNTASLEEVTEMFSYCTGLSSINIKAFDLSNVIIMSRLFEGCTQLSSLDLSGMDLSSAEELDCLFIGCSGLTDIDLTGINTEAATEMTDMFKGCSNLETIDLSDLDTGNVWGTNGMFMDCTKLKTLNLSDLDVSSVYSLSDMFSGCTSLESVTFPVFSQYIWDTSNMFWDCSSLTKLDISGIAVDSGNEDSVNVTDMFFGCNALNELTLSSVTAVTEDMCLGNGSSYEPGWSVKGDDTYSNISGSGEVAVISAPGAKTSYVWKSSNPAPRLIGDINRDGIVDIRDATAIQKHIAELITLEGSALTAADTDGSGTVDIDDVTAVQKFIARLTYTLG